MRDSETPRFIRSFCFPEIPLLHRNSEIQGKKIVKNLFRYVRITYEGDKLSIPGQKNEQRNNKIQEIREQMKARDKGLKQTASQKICRKKELK
jgi:hypothetical protein